MSVVDEIKQRLDIVEVISSYTTLKKAGRNYKGLCPFHAEKTPSFVVFPDTQSWHCFGACGTGGDVFTFIERQENLDFSGALRLLASWGSRHSDAVDSQRHRACGTEMEPRWYCPTCEHFVTDQDEDVRFF